MLNNRGYPNPVNIDLLTIFKVKKMVPIDNILSALVPVMYSTPNNKINTSIKLTLEIVLETHDFNKISQFEKIVNKIDLISSFRIKKFTVNKNIYEISYSGNPYSLIKKFSNFDIPLIYDGEKWVIQ